MSSQKPKPKFFQGTTEDLDDLHHQVTDWLEATAAVPLNYAINVRYCEESDRWAILAVVLYLDGPVIQPARPQVAVPGLGFSVN